MAPAARSFLDANHHIRPLLMNDLSAKSMRACTKVSRSAFMVGLAVLAAGVGLSGCADLRRASFLPPVNPESPVAAQVEVGARRNFQTPAFTNVPPAPKNVPSAPAVKSAVFTLVGCRVSFQTWKRQNPAMVSDTSGFAVVERARVDSNPADVPTKAQDAASQAYAEQMKAYASPPAVLASGPAPSASELVPPPPKGAAAPPAAAASSAKAKPARPVKNATAAKPAPRPAASSAAPAASAAAPSSAVAPMAVQQVALAPPPPPPGTDPLLQHCQ
jgi:hypothetical protein